MARVSRATHVSADRVAGRAGADTGAARSSGELSGDVLVTSGVDQPIAYGIAGLPSRRHI